MESLARGGFGWPLNPGCLWDRSVSCLICPTVLSHIALWVVNTCARKDGALAGRMASGVWPPGNGSFCLSLPSPYI